MKDSIGKFEDAVRGYLAGTRNWDFVHKLAVQMEWDDDVYFPREIRRPMEELHMLFMSDSNDDKQFRASNREIISLLNEADRLRSDVLSLGKDVVSVGETILEDERNEKRRAKYRERHRR